MDAEREALMQADRDFATETARRGGDGWADYFVQDAVMFGMTGRYDGQDAIRERMREVLTPDSKLLWEPQTAAVAQSGDLGYTIGRWQSVAVEGDVETVTGTGNYITVWRKHPELGWRVAADMGNVDGQE